jgi:inhibitor of KinA
VKIRLAGDTMLMVEWDQVIDPAINDEVIALASRLQVRLSHRVRDIVPAYCSLGIHFDPLATDLAALEAVVQDEAGRCANAPTASDDRAPVEIAVRYGGADGPDLDAVARWAGCNRESVIERHCAPSYRVYMLGFVPGFSYMGRVDPTIAAPRHRVPRERVPAGSVGIAGEQTGVYPIPSPGGWQLIGRTDAVMFDPARAEPSLLRAGDLVRFRPARRT